MSPLDPQNYTPLDLRELQKKTMFSTVQAAPARGKKGPSTIPFINVMLVGSIITLVLSLSYSIQSTRLSSNSRASTPVANAGYFSQKSVVTSVQNIPKSYGAEEIPKELMSNIETKYGSLQEPNKKKYIIDKLVRYYIYRDVLKENNQSLPDPTNDFNQVIDQVPQMEKTIKDTLLSKAYFAYVKALFKTDGEKKRAQTLVENYKKRFVETNNFADVVNESNADEALTKLNGNDKNDTLQDYYADDNTFLDNGFNTFLFTQTDRVTSDLYVLKTTLKKDFGYVVVYPVSITKRKYLYLDDIIKEKIGKFK